MKKGYLGMLAMGIMLAVVILPIANSLAQGEAAMAQDGAQVELAEAKTFGQLLAQGGPFMYPLGLFSVAALFFIIQNSLMLREKKMLRPDLYPQIEELMKARDVDGLRELCDSNDSLLTAVLDAGLERISEEHEYDAAHIMEAVEEAGNEQMVIFMKSINFLSIIGGTAPMLGLLGTVSGMIKAFQHIGAGGMGNPEILANDIGEALITTAVGLIIAIPSMIAYFIFKNNFIKSMSTMGRKIGHFFNLYRYAK